MGKELRVLEAFQLFCKELKIENSVFANTIETALKEKAELDDRLSGFNNSLMSGFTYKGKIICACSLEHYDDLVKKEEILEIIKKKRVNVGNFIDMLEDWSTITYEDWLSYKEENGYDIQEESNELEFGIITKEEFDSLKEVLS